MKTCTFEGCHRPLTGRGMCSGHYYQWSKGRGLTPLKQYASGTARDRLDFYSVDTASGCKEWVGTLNAKGYGSVRVDGRLRPAHRVAYELARGPIGEGLVIDHMCHNRGCINPDHLQAVTPKLNSENFAGLRKTNTTGVRNVERGPKPGTWLARFQSDGVVHYVGTFDDIEEAATAVRDARNRVLTNNLLDRVDD